MALNRQHLPKEARLEKTSNRVGFMNTTKHILVVDDENEIGHAISAYLSEEGYRVSVAQNGVQMHKILQRHVVDLVILDLILPGEHGLDIARGLREESNIGIIMLTGHVAAVDCIVGLEMGADDYIAKPANLRELLARVRSVLRRKDTDGSERGAASNLVPIRISDETIPACIEKSTRDIGTSFGRLTRREREVLTLLLSGYSNKEIARSIEVQEVTAAFHLKGVFRKLGVSNRTQAAAMALRNGWAQPDSA